MQPILARVRSITEGKHLQEYITERFGLETVRELESCDGSRLAIRLKENQPPHDLEALRQFSEGFAVGYNAADEQAADEAFDASIREGAR